MLQWIISFIFLFSISAQSNEITNVIGETPDISVAFDFEFNPLTPHEIQKEAENYRACYLAYPNERDRAGRYCNNAYGVMYDGYIVDATCYRSSNQAYDKMQTIEACRYRPPVRMGYCELVNPSERDRGNRYCNNAYGFSYDGYIVDSTCYRSIDRAIDRMKMNRACRDRPAYGSCRIASPNQRDRNGRYCNNAYGVMHRGHILDGRCYSTLEQAHRQMRQSRVCDRR